jgi:dTDP-4-dehydrorhamnose 3,5-epimerase-like enzyme
MADPGPGLGAGNAADKSALERRRLVGVWSGRPERSPVMPLSDCRIIDLPKMSDRRGNLTFVEGGNHIPFDIKRVYYLYDVPGGSDRGEHAHKRLHQFFVCMSGSFDLLLKDGARERRFHLNRSYYGIYVCPMIWRYLDNFSSGAVCMVLASAPYDEADYIRDYDEYLAAVDAT